MANQTIVVYSEGDTRSAELIQKTRANVTLKKITPDTDPEAEPLDLYLNHNILLGLELANPYVKKYFPNLKVDYDKETISGYPEVSPDGKYIVKSIWTLSYTITVVGGFSEEDTWKATHAYLGIPYMPTIPVGLVKVAEFVAVYTKVNPLKSDNEIMLDLWNFARDEFNKQVTEEAYLSNPRIAPFGLYLGLTPQYEFRCDVYGKSESPLLPILIAGLGALGSAILWTIIFVGIIVIAYKIFDWFTQREITAQTKEKTDVIKDKEQLLAQGQISEELATKIDETLEQVTPAPTDWMTTLMNMLPLIIGVAVIATVLSMIPRPRRED